jgi:predicted nucleic acid-binding Zn ribbon protein
MPSYEYRDLDGTVTEHFFPMGKAPRTIGSAIRIVSGTAAVSFKGSGFTKKTIVGESLHKLEDEKSDQFDY